MEIKEHYYCSNCFKDFEIDVTEVCEAVEKINEFKNSKFSIVNLNVGCPYCGINACFNIDKKMIPVIRFLNELGYETAAHCSGHLTRSPFHFKSTHPYSAYLVIYITKEEKEIIQQISINPHLEVEFHKEIAYSGIADSDIYTRYSVNIYYIPRITSEEKIDSAIQDIFEYVSKFPKSDSFNKGEFSNVVMEDD